ncbi:MAG: CotH kinase family protein [Clostridia bacterium]|nr:CotH kinase family protein [Clostridia bacterium]
MNTTPKSPRTTFGVRELCCTLVFLLLFVLIFFWFSAWDRVLPEGSDPERESPISVDAFLGGYEDVLAELNGTAVVPEPTVLPDPDPITFSLDSEPSAFFSDDVTLTLKETNGRRDCDIYFTTDGSYPTPDNGTWYLRPIELPATGEYPTAYHFAAAAYYDDGTVSELCCRTYFVGENVDHYLNMLVFSINVPEEDLWSLERGIFHQNNLWGRGIEWERKMTLQMFESDGSRIFTMPAGMRLYGNYSRTMVQKPMRFRARPIYSEILDDFNTLTMFGAMYDSEGVRIDRFEDLVLRNAGNDFGTAFMRDELVQTLMTQQGFPFTQPVRPCVVYVNGVMYGLYWVHEMFQENYFENRYGMYDYRGEFVVLDGPERNKVADGNEHDGFDPLADYRQMIQWGETLDLTDDNDYALLCRVLDVDSYLRLNATMAYVDNGDWPQNNNRVFKYFAAPGEDFSDVYGMDGKWYFVPHDTDWAFSNDVNTNTLTRYYDPTPRDHNTYSPLFVNLMQREDCQETYITYLLDMMNGAFHPDRMAKTVQDIADTLYPVLEMYLECSPYVAANFDMAAFERRYGRIITYAQNRAEVMYRHIDSVYMLGTLYTLQVDVPDGAGVQVNTLKNSGDFSGIYSSHFATTLTPICPVGYEFDHWEMKGEKYYDEVFYARYAYNIDGVTDVKLVLREDGKLRIKEVNYAEGADVITLYNPNSYAVSTLGYSLTDTDGAPRRFSMPVITLEPGQELIVYCQNCDPSVVLHHMQAPFNLSKYETLYLYHTDSDTKRSTAVDTVYLPNLHPGSLFVRNPSDDKFYEILYEEREDK